MVKKAQSGNQKQKNKPFKGAGISKNKKFVMGSTSKQIQKAEKTQSKSSRKNQKV